MKTIILQFAVLAYSLLFTVVCTVGTISVFKENLHNRFDDSGDDDFEESSEDRTERNTEENSFIGLLIFSGMNITFIIGYIIMMIKDIIVIS